MVSLSVNVSITEVVNIRQRKKYGLFLICLISSLCFFSCKKSQPSISVNLRAHDPSIIFSNGKYYLFGTGPGILEWSSTDLKTWSPEPQIFNVLPSWINEQIPGFSNDIWAPDISYFNGQYYLFYAISQFGTNNSAIGLATNVTLNKDDSLYNWVDRGKILSSAGTSYNAIDPNLVSDFGGNTYLSFGSFFDGIHILSFNADSFKVQSFNNPLPSIASRSTGPSVNAIEAPFIFKHNNYYYLFASIGSCCEGIYSTYETIVGRSSDINGVYKDSKNLSMAEGGGDALLQGYNNWHGAGGGSVYQVNSETIIVFFSYDNAGIAHLRIAQLIWSDSDWPTAKQIY